MVFTGGFEQKVRVAKLSLRDSARMEFAQSHTTFPFVGHFSAEMKHGGRVYSRAENFHTIIFRGK